MWPRVRSCALSPRTLSFWARLERTNTHPSGEEGTSDAPKPSSTGLRKRMADTLDSDVQEAWQRYLAVLKDQPLARYLEVEPWAWKQLRVRLREIEARRAATKGAA